jgi:hypothetical protein
VQHPAGWIVPEWPSPLPWADLSQETREFAGSSLAQAHAVLPNSRLFLFGSRAAGTTSASSDYDFLFVYADDAVDRKPFAIGDINSFANDRGACIDLEDIPSARWQRPDEPDELIVDIVRQCGIEVPRSL